MNLKDMNKLIEMYDYIIKKCNFMLDVLNVYKESDCDGFCLLELWQFNNLNRDIKNIKDKIINTLRGEDLEQKKYDEYIDDILMRRLQ